MTMMRSLSPILLQSLVILHNNEGAVAFHMPASASPAVTNHAFSTMMESSPSATVTVTSTSTSKSKSTNNVRPSSQLNSFFKDLFGSAFENDQNLSSDKSEQQLEGPNDDISNIFTPENQKTEVQKRWLESQKAVATSSSASTTASSSFSSSITSKSTSKGAPINPDVLPGTSWELSLYLTGVPDFDPSNSLYGSKVNISTRRDSSMAKDGFAIGADALPSDPSTICSVQFMDDGICKVSESSFTSSIDGEWKLSDDGRMIRFSLDVKGFQRTVTTMGTIQNVNWTDQDDVQRKSSATYSIPSGLIYAEASIGYGSKPGVFVMAMGDKVNNAGLLKVEKRIGVFGVSSKMLACGKFSAEMVVDNQ